MGGGPPWGGRGASIRPRRRTLCGHCIEQQLPGISRRFRRSGLLFLERCGQPAHQPRISGSGLQPISTVGILAVFQLEFVRWRHGADQGSGQDGLGGFVERHLHWRAKLDTGERGLEGVCWKKCADCFSFLRHERPGTWR